MGIESLTWAALVVLVAIIFVAVAPGVVRGETSIGSLSKAWIGAFALLLLMCAGAVYTSSNSCSFLELFQLQASAHACSIHGLIGWAKIVFPVAAVVAFTLLIVLALSIPLLRKNGR